MGQLYSARDGEFDVNIHFIGLNADKPEHFLVSYEEYRIKAEQDYPNITIHYPWDEQ